MSVCKVYADLRRGLKSFTFLRSVWKRFSHPLVGVKLELLWLLQVFRLCFSQIRQTCKKHSHHCSLPSPGDASSDNMQVLILRKNLIFNWLIPASSFFCPPRSRSHIFNLEFLLCIAHVLSGFLSYIFTFWLSLHAALKRS